MKNRDRFYGVICLSFVLFLSALTSCGTKPSTTTNQTELAKTSVASGAEKKLERTKLATLAGTDVSLVSAPVDGRLWLSLEKANGGTATELGTVATPTVASQLSVLQGDDKENVFVAGAIYQDATTQAGKGSRKVSILYDDKGATPYVKFLTKSVIVPMAESDTAFLAKMPKNAEVFGVVITDSKGTPQFATIKGKSVHFDQSGKALNLKRDERVVAGVLSGEPQQFGVPEKGWIEKVLVKGDYELVFHSMDEGTAPSLRLRDKKNSISLGSLGGGAFGSETVEAYIKDSTVIWGVVIDHLGYTKYAIDQRAVKVGISAGGATKVVPVKDGLYVSVFPKDSQFDNVWYLDANDNLIGLSGIQIEHGARYFPYKP